MIRIAMVIMLLATAVGLIWGHKQPTSDTEYICQNWADKLYPSGYYTFEQRRDEYRACIGRNSESKRASQATVPLPRPRP
jgi:hypothetical protein